MSILNDSSSLAKDDTRASAPQNTSVGSGSRPTKSSIPIPTSAPTNPETLGRSEGTNPLK